MTKAFHQDPADKNGAKDELSVQVSFRNKMRSAAPQVMLVGVPNAGRRSQWEARQRSKEGLVKGFPDMMAFYDGHCAGLEFKSGKGRVSPDQTDTLIRLVERKIPVGVFRSPETAIDWLRGNWPAAFEVSA